MEQPDYIIELLRLEQKDKEVMERAKQLSSPETYAIIEEQMEEDDGYYSCFDIVDEPIGDYQEDDNRWVNQTCNGGYLGDEFAGTICYKLNDNKYLKYHYSM